IGGVVLYAQLLETFYAKKQADTPPRQRGDGRKRIEYRHVIAWLVRKPGAFKHYRYRQDLFPTHRFRVAYDQLKGRLNGRSSKEYLRILLAAARENEAAVDEALRQLIETGQAISAERVEERIATGTELSQPREIVIDEVELQDYDALLHASPSSTEGGRTVA